MTTHDRKSPSSRRAWIEIAEAGAATGAAMVALLAEGVDRNRKGEISLFSGDWVALLAEGVDRNSYAQLPQPQPVRRPPRGGRG